MERIETPWRPNTSATRASTPGRIARLVLLPHEGHHIQREQLRLLGGVPGCLEAVVLDQGTVQGEVEA